MKKRYSKPRTLPQRELSRKAQHIMMRSDEMGETNDCSVRAIAALTDLPYALVHLAFQKAGRQPKAGVNDFETSRALATLGYEMVSVGELHLRHKKWQQPKPAWVKKITDQYPGHHKELAGLTTYHAHKFPEVWAKLPPMLLTCRNHYAAFKDGKVHDWAANKPQQIKAAHYIRKIECPDNGQDISTTTTLGAYSRRMKRE